MRHGYSSTGYPNELRDDDSGEWLHSVEVVGAYGPERFRFGNGASTEQRYDPHTGFLAELTHKNTMAAPFTRSITAGTAAAICKHAATAAYTRARIITKNTSPTTPTTA